MRRGNAPEKYRVPDFWYYFCSTLRIGLGTVVEWPTQRPHKDIRVEIAWYLSGWYETHFGTRHEFGQETVDLWCSILVAGHAGKTISSAQVNRYDELMEAALKVQLFPKRPPNPRITGELRKNQSPAWAVAAVAAAAAEAAAKVPPAAPRPSLKIAISRLRSLIAPK